MRQRTLRTVAVLGAAVVALAGCGGGTGASGDGAFDPAAVFRYAVPGMPTSFDPAPVGTARPGLPGRGVREPRRAEPGR